MPEVIFPGAAGRVEGRYSEPPREGAPVHVSTHIGGAASISGERFACPDNICIDSAYNVWIATDGGDDARDFGPYIAEKSAYFMSLNRGMDGIPHRANVLIADTSTGIYAFQAVAAALFAREREAEGRYLDISLMQGTAAFMAPKIVEYHAEKGNPRVLNAPAGSYRTKDGWVAITLLSRTSSDRERFSRFVARSTCRAMSSGSEMLNV